MRGKISGTRLLNPAECGCCGGLPRREFLKGLAAVGAAAVLSDELLAQSAISKEPRIDIHSHFAAPAWATAVTAKKAQGLFGTANPMGAFKDWTPARLIEQMDEVNVSTAFLSVT